MIAPKEPGNAEWPGEWTVHEAQMGVGEPFLVVCGNRAIGHYPTRDVAQGIADLLTARDKAARRAALEEAADVIEQQEMAHEKLGRCKCCTLGARAIRKLKGKP